MTSFKFPAIGTQWQIDIYDTLQDRQIEELRLKIYSRIEEFDKTFSRFRDDSWVSSHKDFIGTSPLPRDILPLLTFYQTLNRLSEGRFTPLIGKTLEQAGYDKDYSLKAGKLVQPPYLTEALAWDDKSITFKKEVLLDFGAAGKGYLVDLIGKFLVETKIRNYCIDASGDILFKTESKKPIRVGLEHPDDPLKAVGVAEILNKSICASAGNRRKWGEFHHTIDPLTLLSPDGVKAVWVTADSALLADALTTCLYLDPDPRKYTDFNFECVLMYKDNSAYRSLNFPGELFTG